MEWNMQVETRILEVLEHALKAVIAAHGHLCARTHSLSDLL